MDAVDLILGTGCRIGEIGALIYAEIDLAASAATLTVSGTTITETGAGTYRQPWTKSSAGYRTLFLPPFAVGILLRRQVENHANPYGAVFPTRRGTWRQISNWERMWNRVVDDTAYDWVTFHTFRRSVAALIDREVGIDAAQAQWVTKTVTSPATSTSTSQRSRRTWLSIWRSSGPAAEPGCPVVSTLGSARCSMPSAQG